MSKSPNERFGRDFLQKSHVKVSKASISYETSSKSHGEPPSEHTHQAALPSSFADSSPSAHTPIPMSQRQSPPPQLATSRFPATATKLSVSTRLTSNARKVLRLPRTVTSATPRNLTLACACHENRISTPQSPHRGLLRLPRKVTISYHVSFNKHPARLE